MPHDAADKFARSGMAGHLAAAVGAAIAGTGANETRTFMALGMSAGQATAVADAIAQGSADGGRFVHAGFPAPLAVALAEAIANRKEEYANG